MDSEYGRGRPTSVEGTTDASIKRPQRPTFILGMGCMKGGTTWLHHYLAASPHCAPGFVKEFHVFDSLDRPELAWVLRRIHAGAARAREHLRAGGTPDPTDAGRLLQATMIEAPEPHYYDYFAGLLATPGARATMDLTPNYGLLGAARLAGIVRRFETRAIRTVSVFVMRDPVERIWSQIRMQQQRRPGPGGRVSAEDLVRERYMLPEYAERTRYERTLEALETVFAPGDRHVGFYETRFDPAELGRICHLAGMAPHTPDLTARSNASAKTGDLPEATARLVARHFAPTYEAVAHRVGRDRLAELWSSSRFID